MLTRKKIFIFFLKGSGTHLLNYPTLCGKYIYDSLEISRDIKNIRNSIIVRGGTYEANESYENLRLTATKQHLISLINTAICRCLQSTCIKDNGIDFLDDPTSFDALYNFKKKPLCSLMLQNQRQDKLFV